MKAGSCLSKSTSYPCRRVTGVYCLCAFSEGIFVVDEGGVELGEKILGKEMDEWIRNYPLLEKVNDYRPVTWLNDGQTEEKMDIEQVSMADMEEARDRWKRFSPYLIKKYPEMEKMDGKIESPLLRIDAFRREELHDDLKNGEEMYLKCDHLLPIAGSIKARGGIYEVFKYAEQIALDQKLISHSDSYEQFSSDRFKDCFKNYTIGVGSTGNLALSIGIAGADLGFQVHVYMSKDAREWKKELLKQHGVEVQEFTGDFSKAIEVGRKETQDKENSYFIDDENSKDLFMGYSVAALELKKQLEEEGINISEKHPLFVYLPCGVGGSPGGIAFGLKMIFGSNVHCFYAEPTHSPSVLIGLMTGLKEKISVQDFGLDNKTSADGLAVGRPSSFASSISMKTVSGIYTEEDNTFQRMGYKLWQLEKEFIEPSAAAGLTGPKAVKKSGYRNKKNIVNGEATHIAWSTGGSLVPKEERFELYKIEKENDIDV